MKPVNLTPAAGARLLLRRAAMATAFAGFTSPPTELRTARATPLPDGMERIDCFDESNATRSVGKALRLIRDEARRFRSELRATGMPEYVESFDIISVPYPTSFGLFRATWLPTPFLTLTNRLLVVRWRSRDGAQKTLLFEPTDQPLAANVPFYAELSRSTPKFLHPLQQTIHSSLLERLEQIGIMPGEVDYLAFDHLHTQDVRRLIGTRGPAPDLSPREAIAPWFPRAKLIVQKSEMELIREMHPLQSPWYQPETFVDLRPEGLLEIDGDCLLGPGVALITTPGHAAGNQSLALNMATGIWATSENVIATECLTPEHSKIPGLRKYPARTGLEIVLNGNTLEATAEQYNSVLKEKSIVDRSQIDERFLQFFPSSELTKNRANPGTAPTFVHRRLEHGKLVRES